jgi:integrase
MPSVRLTDSIVRRVSVPAAGNRITYDAEVKGFGLRVTAAGAKAFVVNYRIDGRERRITIGAYPDWSVAAAREQAKALKRDVDRGIDPLGKRIDDREAPTVHDLWTEYERTHLPTKRTRSAADDRSMWRAYILPKLGSIKVRDLNARDIDDLHAEIGRTKPVRANRVIAVLRKALNLAVRWRWRNDNPAIGVKRNHEERRERHLTPHEVDRLTESLDRHPNRTAARAIRLLLLTGARKTEGFTATWAMFDLDAGVWVKPASHTKQNRLHRVPLSTAAIELLKEIKAEMSADPIYIFRAPRRQGPVTDVKRTWASVLKAADLSDVRLHDLRHTYASILASDDVPLHVVGALLGHTQAQTTKRYAHLYDEPLRRATEAAARRIQNTSR